MAVMGQQKKNDELVDYEDLIRMYKRTGDRALKDQIVLHYSKQITIALHSMRSVLLPSVPIEDLFNQGVIVLITCLDRYEPDRGASFDTYIYKGIRGAIYNYMRKQSWLTNRVRDARKKIISGRAELTQKLSRDPTSAELAEYIEIPEKKLDQYLVEMNLVETLSLEELLEQTYTTILDKTQSIRQNAIEQELLQKELLTALGEAIDQLPARQKQIITMCYYENLNLREIGDVLGLTQQRVSQIRSAALQQLNKMLKQYE